MEGKILQKINKLNLKKGNDCKMKNETIDTQTNSKEMLESEEKQLSSKKEKAKNLKPFAKKSNLEEIALAKRLIAEFLGTYFLVFAGTGGLILDHITGDLGHFGTSLVFGLALMIVIFTFSHLSGAHVNPAISLAFLIQGKINVISTITYMIAQILGAITASWTLYMMFGQVAKLGATLPVGTGTQTFVLEAILTFFLTLIILSSVYGNQGKPYTGIAAGSVLFFAMFFAAPLTGASLNPARSIGPALISGATEGLEIYIIAAFTGAIIAAFISKFINE